jgi:hypothetical protein
MDQGVIYIEKGGSFLGECHVTTLAREVEIQRFMIGV